jgi:hypothetical protein
MSGVEQPNPINSCGDCVFLGQEIPLTREWELCADPSAACIEGLGRLRGRLAAVDRLGEMAQNGHGETFNLEQLQEGDTVILYGGAPKKGYGDEGCRTLSVYVHELRTVRAKQTTAPHYVSGDAPAEYARVVHASVLADSLNDLPSTEVAKRNALQRGERIHLGGSWDAREKYTRYGIAVVGQLLTYRPVDEDKSYGLLMQEICVIDPRGARRRMWNTDPKVHRVTPDYLIPDWDRLLG